MPADLGSLITAVLIVTLAGGAYGLPRGVDPASAASFAGTGGTFTCLDGSKTIPFAQVNDNYCDCPSDGSDEPGTPACYYGKFYCANRGHQPQLLSASFVDDGVCDCCDGSDEKTACTNTCLDKGAAERQQVRDKATEMQQSLEKKKQLISEGTERQRAWPARAASLPSELKAQEQEIARLEGEKTTMQAAADEDRKRLQAEEEERHRQNAGKEAAEAAAAAEAGAAEQAANPSEGGEADAEAPQETDEERGRRIASQWTNDPDAASAPAEGQEVMEDGGEEGFDEGDHHHDGEYDSGGYHGTSPPTPSHVYSPLDSEVYQISAKLEEARKRLEELKAEVALVNQHYSGAKFDYGPGNQFISLAGRCIAETGARWLYEACFYSHAIQQEPHNLNNKVSLGRWSGWANDYTEALFENGDACAGAPNRSFRVKLVCGQEEQLWGGEEPSTCVYTAWLMTPLACRQSDLEAEFAKLAELEKFEAEVRAEIEAAAAAKANAHTEL